MTRAWVNDTNAALLTDLYQLTMLQAYVQEGMEDAAVFDLFARRLPDCRNFLVAAGLDDALHYLETLSFSAEALDYLATLGKFSPAFLDYLAGFRFTGDVYAMPEGTLAYADEPLLEVVAPIAQAQLVETFLLNQVQFQTVAASKAARVVLAAQGRMVVDFGLRRMQGADAGMKAMRAFYIAGVDATSNVLAGQVYGFPVSGTMAHSYIEAHDDESMAYRAFAKVYPDTVLLVDTYDTLDGVHKVVQLAREQGDAFQVRAVRLDSGNVTELAKRARQILDDAGLGQIGIFVSGSLDEHRIARMIAEGAPVNGFGVGTRMGVSNDAPYLDSAYKLVEYAGRARMKLSTGKSTLPRRKQVFRRHDGDRAQHDVIALQDEQLEGTPLLKKVMEHGRRLPAGQVDLGEARERARQGIASLPQHLRALQKAEPGYRVEISDALRRERDRLAAMIR